MPRCRGRRRRWPSGVRADVINPVRDGLAQLPAGEVMYADLLGLAAGPVLAAAVLIQPGDFLLLGVHADHRITRGQSALDRRVDVAELGIAIGVPAAFQ